MTIPLQCGDESHSSFQHAFLLSEVCPINLMGRDLMCKLGLCLISTPEGVRVLRLSDLAPNASHTFVHHTPNMTYAYLWQLQPLTNFPEFVSAKNTISTASTDFMAKDDLQCTSHVSPESDESYEEDWLKERFDKLTLTHIFWTEHKCAVSVSLTPAQCNMYTMDYSAPHIPLAKHTSDNLEEIGKKQLIDLSFFHLHCSATQKG